MATPTVTPQQGYQDIINQVTAIANDLKLNNDALAAALNATNQAINIIRSQPAPVSGTQLDTVASSLATMDANVQANTAQLQTLVASLNAASTPPVETPPTETKPASSAGSATIT